MTQEALKLALEALSVLKPDNWVDKELQGRAWDAVKEALAQPEQEPVAWLGFNERGECREVFTRDMKKTLTNYSTEGMTPVYTTPPQRTEQDGQCKRCADGCPACDATKLQKESHDLL